MGAAAAGAGALLLWLFGSGDLAVEEEVAAVRYLHTARTNVNACFLLHSNALQLALIDADYYKRAAKTHYEGNSKPDRRQRFLRHMVYIVRFSAVCLGNEIVTLIRIDFECVQIISICQIRFDLFPDVLDACIRKCGNSISGCGNVQSWFFQAYQQQYTVTVRSIAKITHIVKIIRIILYAAPPRLFTSAAVTSKS